ncbi:hypothetical protein Y032_0050g1983 [Ancylostoma ceylanicum]|uniref:Uncharacterized protein n=1 Tax=Ancylostoma ceylanicum TaxID=53326 RepID=A0A016U8W7_9BILA|nr:hypothetical protein Y032_0050g1983 [Ancylostoma ceylanicum]
MIYSCLARIKFEQVGVIGSTNAPIRVFWLHPFFTHDDTHPKSWGRASNFETTATHDYVPLIKVAYISNIAGI